MPNEPRHGASLITEGVVIKSDKKKRKGMKVLKQGKIELYEDLEWFVGIEKWKRKKDMRETRTADVSTLEILVRKKVGGTQKETGERVDKKGRKKEKKKTKETERKTKFHRNRPRKQGKGKRQKNFGTIYFRSKMGTAIGSLQGIQKTWHLKKKPRVGA